MVEEKGTHGVAHLVGVLGRARLDHALGLHAVDGRVEPRALVVDVSHLRQNVVRRVALRVMRVRVCARVTDGRVRRARGRCVAPRAANDDDGASDAGSGGWRDAHDTGHRQDAELRRHRRARRRGRGEKKGAVGLAARGFRMRSSAPPRSRSTRAEKESCSPLLFCSSLLLCSFDFEI